MLQTEVVERGGSGTGVGDGVGVGAGVVCGGFGVDVVGVAVGFGFAGVVGAGLFVAVVVVAAVWAVGMTGAAGDCAGVRVLTTYTRPVAIMMIPTLTAMLFPDEFILEKTAYAGGNYAQKEPRPGFFVVIVRAKGLEPLAYPTSRGRSTN